MKAQFTFAEVSKIFAQVEKVENAVKEYEMLAEKYNEIDAKFDDEFDKYNYTFFGAPAELHTMFEEKCAAMKQKDNAERKAFRAIKTFGELIEIGGRYMDIVEERLKKYIDGTYYWHAVDMIERVKHLALAASRRISLN